MNTEGASVYGERIGSPSHQDRTGEQRADDALVRVATSIRDHPTTARYTAATRTR